MLPKLADGFSTQRGKIFGFGPEAESQSTTFKISSATNEELQKFDTTATHNLGEERSVGLMNYEFGIRGKSNLETSSQKLILNKSFVSINLKKDIDNNHVGNIKYSDLEY